MSPACLPGRRSASIRRPPVLTPVAGLLALRHHLFVAVQVGGVLRYLEQTPPPGPSSRVRAALQTREFTLVTLP
ncbi:hypothetical protein [Streptomyces violascens]|uniref:hypothetical protein n=1 Tax=Streptomyces violascens TaxID=67381 RepID=UPI0036CC4992